MDVWGYSWQPFEVTTEDGYILTTFHITGKVGEPRQVPNKATVIINHGLFGEAWNWVAAFQSGKPSMLQLVDNGYDIWMTNNRGTQYSLGHQSKDATKDDTYW